MTSKSNIIKYPLAILAREVSKYARRIRPCIMFFANKAHPINDKLLIKITLICEKYPDICCFKVGWISHQKNFPKKIPSGLFDVTVWSQNKKLMVMTNPTLENLTQMFEYVRKLQIETYHNYYPAILSEDYIKKNFVENEKHKLLETETNIKYIHENFNLKSLCMKPESSNFYYNNALSPINISKPDNINNNFDQTKFSDQLLDINTSSINPNKDEPRGASLIQTDHSECKTPLDYYLSLENTYKLKDLENKKLISAKTRFFKAYNQSKYREIKPKINYIYIPYDINITQL